MASLEPKKAKLKELDAEIEHCFQEIIRVKARIVENDEKIDKLIGTVRSDE